ncbi:MAG: hypothetical protein HQK96_04345 [Nitrospirae bacterium]|nr:hypothetical protein [Nitrospirota bacterium]
MKKNKDPYTSRFKIDFFEFSFLVESCIPQVPIARTMFWQRVINEHYHELTMNERARLFDWIQCNYSFKQGMEEKVEDVVWFYDRFNPDNQYKVTYEFDGETESVDCFKHCNNKGVEHYYTQMNRFVADEYIVKIEKLS